MIRRAESGAEGRPMHGPWACVLVAACLSACADRAPSAGATIELRPDTPGTDELFRYAAGDTVEHFDSTSGAFRVHFTRAGSHAIATRDDDGSGTPDAVERVAELYDSVLAFYRDTLGYRVPLDDLDTPGDDGGDGRFDVYLLDFAGRADGAFRRERCVGDRCSGFMVQENDFRGYPYPSAAIGDRIVASHEFFHAIQASYDAHQDRVPSEGTAVWATERFDPSLDDFEAFADGYLDDTTRSIDVPPTGPVDPFSYGTGIFFRFLGERFGDDLIRALWEDSENGARGVSDPAWVATLDAALAREHASDFSRAFTEFAQWNLRTGDRADPSRSYEEGAGYPEVAMERLTLPYEDTSLRIFHASAHYFSARPGSRDRLTAALVAPQGVELEDVHLFLASVTGDVVADPVELAEPRAGTQTIDASSADEVVVLIVNAAPDGDSVRPGLCVGDAEEVAACIQRSTPRPDAGLAEPDAGASDAALAPDASAGVRDPGGEGCAVSPRTRSASSLALGALVFGLLTYRLRGGRARRRRLG